MWRRGLTVGLIALCIGGLRLYGGSLPPSPVASVSSGHGVVVSAGLCADQAVVRLLPRARIRGVSKQATDTLLSPVAAQAKGLPVFSPDAETLLMSGADLVVLNAYGDRKTAALLRRLGVRVVRVPYDARMKTIPHSLRVLGRKLHATQTADSLARDFEDRVRALRRQTMKRTMERGGEGATVAAYYRPDGGSAGRNTYVADAMEIAGYMSLASKLGIVGWGRLDLESVILNAPDMMILSFFSPHRLSVGPSVGQSFAHHPVLRALMESHPVLSIPGHLWGCGGWPIIDAADVMAGAHP